MEETEDVVATLEESQYKFLGAINILDSFEFEKKIKNIDPSRIKRMGQLGRQHYFVRCRSRLFKKLSEELKNLGEKV